MSRVALRVDRLGKRYRLGRSASGYRSIRESLTNAATQLMRPVRSRDRDDQVVWALRDVSFEQSRGEVLGVIGRNGAGKSTLLKILSRITEPTEGQASVYGRVGSLLEVGTGFHPELTGRENVYLNGAILGMRRIEIDRKFDEIVAFAAVERFIDTPIKRFSTGMQVRLAFAVAAHLEPEILFVDEVLSVGDAEFQRRCLDRMRQVTHDGRTIVLVSHDMTAIRSLCARALLLDSGRVVMDGPAGTVVDEYLSHATPIAASVGKDELDRTLTGLTDRGAPTVRCSAIQVVDAAGVPRSSFSSDEPIQIQIDYRCYTTIPDLRIVVFIVDDEGKRLLCSQNTDDPEAARSLRFPVGNYRSTLELPPHLFGERTVRVSVELINTKTEHVAYEGIISFEVRFKPYNDVLYGTLSTIAFRPQLPWVTIRRESPE